MNLQLLTRDVTLLARQAGAYLRQERDSIREEEIGVKGQGDLVSRVDRTSERMLREGLLSLLPDSVVMAEEESPDAGGGDWRWIVDPLDGTLNYLQGLPVYAVSIALEDRRSHPEGWGELVLGVIHLPSLDLMYDAWRGGQARRNGRIIRVRPRRDLSRSTLATGFPFRNHDVLDPYLSVFRDIFVQVANIRRMGSAAADLAWVADGTFDGFWECGLNPWDVAAGTVLIEEAGGIITDFWGRGPLETGWVIGGNRVSYEALQPVIREHFPDPPGGR